MEDSFAIRVKGAYYDFLKSVIPGTSEHDVRSRFIQHFIRKGLGYPEKCIINEKKWADIWLLEKPPVSKTKKDKESYSLRTLPIVVIETKAIDMKNELLSQEANIQQAFKYVAPGATKYVALTNFRRLILWRIENSLEPQSLREAIADVYVEAEATHALFSSQLNKLIPIFFEEITKVYDDFFSSPRISLSESKNFEAFTKIVKWKILDESLIPQFERLATFLSKKYSEYQEKERGFKQLIDANEKKNQKNRTAHLGKRLQI